LQPFSLNCSCQINFEEEEKKIRKEIKFRAPRNFIKTHPNTCSRNHTWSLVTE